MEVKDDINYNNLDKFIDTINNLNIKELSDPEKNNLLIKACINGYQDKNYDILNYLITNYEFNSHSLDWIVSNLNIDVDKNNDNIQNSKKLNNINNKMR